MERKMKISIKNFKAILNAEIELSFKTSNRLIAITGNNNSGKSTFIEAIKKLSENTNIQEKDRTHYLETTLRKSTENPFIKFSFLFEKENEENIFLETRIENDVFYPTDFDPKWIQSQEKIADEKIELLQKTNFNKFGAFIHSHQTFIDDYWYRAFEYKVKLSGNTKAIDLIKEIRKTLQFKKIVDKIHLISVDSTNLFQFSEIDLNLLFKNGDIEPWDTLKQKTLKEWEKIIKIDIKDMLDDRAKANASNKQRIVGIFLEKANKIINEYSTHFFGHESEEKLDIFFDFEKSTFNIRWIPKSKKSNEWIHYDELSETGDGLKNLLSMIFKIQSIGKDIPVIIAIDEPEKHLNPIQQNYLLKFFKKITSSEKRRRNQILIYATHSPFMIDLDLYENTFIMSRNENNNSAEIKKIYESQDSNSPNLLIDKNLEIRYIESITNISKVNKVVFVEGITDFFVLSSICNSNDIFWIPLFGGEYKKTLSYHMPYIMSNYSNDKIKCIVDNDGQGKEIIDWLNNNSNIDFKNIKTYNDLFKKNNLEDAILKPWFNENNLEITKNKKVNSLTFRKKYKGNSNDYIELKKFILK